MLNDCDRLETPAQFVEVLERKLKPREGRNLNAGTIEASVDFQKFFEPLGVVTSGHTQTKGKTQAGLEAVHNFSFQLRKHSAMGLTIESNFKAAPHPEDVVLRCKHYMASEEDSQPAQVFVPHEAFGQERAQLSRRAAAFHGAPGT